MTIFLSTVVVGFPAAVVLETFSPTAAQAAISCLARPSGSAPIGSHWYYRPNRITHQRCWYLSDRASKSEHAIAARTREPAKLPARDTPAVALPKNAADAQARYVDPPVEPAGATDTATSLASSLARAAEKLAKDNLATSTFASRWIELSNSVIGNDRLPMVRSGPDQPDAAVPDEAAPAGEASGRLFKDKQPLDVTLMVFVVSFGGALMLLGLMGRAFLYERPASARTAGELLNVAEFEDPPAPALPKPEGDLAVDELFVLAGDSLVDPASSQIAPGGEQPLPNPFGAHGPRPTLMR
jgi:hypothetical protein